MEPHKPVALDLSWALPEQRIAFGKWLAELAIHARLHYGVGLYDLPTWDYWGHWESGYKPTTAAALALGIHDD
jgi:hypothetical protein